MFIYLVQHGQAKSKEIDPDRHLTEQGIKDVEKISTFAKSAKLKVDAIWHSGKARAAQTAEILSKGINSKNGIIQHDGLTPKDDIDPIKKELIKSKKNIMVVGHLPFLSKLASSLLMDDDSASIVAFQQGGIVCLESDEEKNWFVEWMVVPELIP